MIKRLGLWLGYLLLRALMASYRFRAPRRHPLGEFAGGYLFAIWHQNLFAGILAQTGIAHCVMVSRSRDGDPVSYLCESLGHSVLRGSSRSGTCDKGGKEAKERMIEQLGERRPGAITVDGPRGPAFQVKPGIIEMARRTGVPIVPYLALPRSYWSFRSWDAFRLPKPFTRIDIRYGAPIPVPADTPFEQFPQYQHALAEALHRLERVPVAPPAPLAQPAG